MSQEKGALFLIVFYIDSSSTTGVINHNFHLVLIAAKLTTMAAYSYYEAVGSYGTV